MNANIASIEKVLHHLQNVQGSNTNPQSFQLIAFSTISNLCLQHSLNLHEHGPGNQNPRILIFPPATTPHPPPSPPPASPPPLLLSLPRILHRVLHAPDVILPFRLHLRRPSPPLTAAVAAENSGGRRRPAVEGRPRPGEAGVAAKEKVGGVHAGRRIEKDWISGVADDGRWRWGWRWGGEGEVLAWKLDGARATVANVFSFFK